MPRKGPRGSAPRPKHSAAYLEPLRVFNVRVRAAIDSLVVLFVGQGPFEVAVRYKFGRCSIGWSNVIRVTSTSCAHGSERFKSEYTEPVQMQWRNRSERAISSPRPRGVLQSLFYPCYCLHIDTYAGRLQTRSVTGTSWSSENGI